MTKFDSFLPSIFEFQTKNKILSYFQENSYLEFDKVREWTPVSMLRKQKTVKNMLKYDIFGFPVPEKQEIQEQKKGKGKNDTKKGTISQKSSNSDSFEQGLPIFFLNFPNK